MYAHMTSARISLPEINKQVGGIKMNKTRRRGEAGPGQDIDIPRQKCFIIFSKGRAFILLILKREGGEEKKIPEALKGTGND